MSEASLGRVLLAVALAYLMLLRALFLPFPGAFAAADFGPFGASAICAHASGAGAPDNNSGDPASNHDSCCGDCCLMRIAGLAPLILVAALILFSRFWTRAPVSRTRRIVFGPPARIASRPQAQRAPPRLLFV